MTKVVDFKGKPPEHEQIADMLESFAAAIRENAGVVGAVKLCGADLQD